MLASLLLLLVLGLVSLLSSQNFVKFENFEFFNIALIWHQIWKMIKNSHRKSIVDGVDVTHDVTAWRQIRPSIFMFKGNSHIFHDTDRSCWKIITILGPHMKNGPTHRPVVYLGKKSNNLVTSLKSMSNIKSVINLLIFTLERRSKAQNIGNALGNSNSTLNFRWHFHKNVHQDIKILPVLKISNFSI